MNKIVLFFWGELTKSLSNPVNFPNKEQTYLDLFKEIEDLGAKVFISRGVNNYKGSNGYLAHWKFEEGKLHNCNESILPDIVFDRSGGLNFPTEFMRNIFNSYLFKSFCRNKWHSYIEFKNYFPKTFILDDVSNLNNILSQIKTDKIVIKPIDGMKGNGIYFPLKSQISDFPKIIFENSNRYLIQEYMDTSVGIKGLVEGLHDLRVVILNNEIIWAHIRQPKAGSLKANVADGGSIREVLDFNKIPESILSMVSEIADRLDKEFNNPMYSIDIGMTKDGPKVYEFNSQVGFPLPSMQNKANFVSKLAQRLIIT